MKRIIILLGALVSIFATGCKENKVTHDPINNMTYFGEEFEVIEDLSYDVYYAKMQTQDSLQTQLTGVVESVCKVKGCWVNITSADTPELEGTFVKFKDYGFFLPLDCEGKKVTLNGKAYREITPVDELRHYAEDEGKSEKEIMAITEPVEELKFMADGVAMYN